MYRVPSRRKKISQTQKPNLIPILDAVFIFIFFLLMSANFVKIFEIQSPVPLISNREPPKNKKELGLTLKIAKNSINIYTGIPSRLYKRVSKIESGDYDFQKLHDILFQLKTRFKREKTVILDPIVDLEYEKIIKIMDAVRMMSPTDKAIYIKDKDGLDNRVKDLFSNIIFGDIQS